MNGPVAIIGAGPAGVAAALQLKRAGFEPLLFEKDRIGGLLRSAQRVENYPGFPRGIGGKELAQRLAEQLQAAAVPVIREAVQELDYDGRRFCLRGQRRRWTSSFAILASGTQPRSCPLPPLPRSARERVFYELPPLLSLRRKRVAVIGAGDAAFDYAQSLAGNNRVVILGRSKRPRCLPLLWERSQGRARIEYRPACTLTRVSPIPGGLLLDLAAGGQKRQQLPCHCLLFAIGRRPQLDYLSPRLLRRRRFLLRRGRLLIAGDAGRGIYRQAAIAAGDGTLAAMKIARRLFREKNR